MLAGVTTTCTPDSAASRAARAVGRWPKTPGSGKAAGASGGLLGSFSARHAEQVWNACLADLRAEVRRSELTAGVEALACLGFCALLGQHLARCQRCWRSGPYDSRTPVEWIMWGCGRRSGLAAIVGPILADSGVKMRGRAPG